MAMVHKFGRMAHAMSAFGIKIKHAVRAYCIMQMVIYTVVSGLMIKLMAMGLTCMIMELLTLVTGSKTNKKDMELRHGLMELNIKGTTQMARKTVKVFYSLKTAAPMMEPSCITKFQGSESIFGLTKRHMKACG